MSDKEVVKEAVAKPKKKNCCCCCCCNIIIIRFLKDVWKLMFTIGFRDYFLRILIFEHEIIGIISTFCCVSVCRKCENGKCKMIKEIPACEKRRYCIGIGKIFLLIFILMNNVVFNILFSDLLGNIGKNKDSLDDGSINNSTMFNSTMFNSTKNGSLSDENDEGNNLFLTWVMVPLISAALNVIFFGVGRYIIQYYFKYLVRVRNRCGKNCFESTFNYFFGFFCTIVFISTVIFYTGLYFGVRDKVMEDETKSFKTISNSVMVSVLYESILDFLEKVFLSPFNYYVHVNIYQKYLPCCINKSRWSTSVDDKTSKEKTVDITLEEKNVQPQDSQKTDESKK